MSSTTFARRPRWPWILLAIVVVIGLVIAAVAIFGSHAATPTASPSSTTSAPPSTSADPAPTGCLGGKTRDAAMVIAAQKSAPHTTNGAVEVAAAFTRWLDQYPYPSASDSAEVEKSALASSAPTKDLVSFFANNPNLSGGLVADGEAYYLSTIPGVYHVESADTNEAVVSIGTGLVANGSLSATLRGSITVTVSWQSGAWKFVKSAGTRTTQDLYAIGTPFTGGC